MKPTFFKSPDQLKAWFARHGATKAELWIGYYKKAAGKGGVVYKQALDEALCVGWIDGVVKSIDDTCYMQRYTPRKPKSNWSNVNVKRVGELIAEGRMTPAGLAAFERRDPARTGIYTFEIALQQFSPPLLARFRSNRDAWAFWIEQPPGYRRSATAYVMAAKRDETRERRLAHVIALSAQHQRIPELGGRPPAQPSARTTAKKLSRPAKRPASRPGRKPRER